MNGLLCPFCMAHLNVNGNLVLAAHKDNSERGIFLMSDELGNFDVSYSKNISPKAGDKIHFFCPACAHSLEYKDNKNLVRILKVDKDGSQHTIIFSAIFGEFSTFQINEERTLSFGEHAVRYMDPDWYRKV